MSGHFAVVLFQSMREDKRPGRMSWSVWSIW